MRRSSTSAPCDRFGRSSELLGRRGTAGLVSPPARHAPSAVSSTRTTSSHRPVEEFLDDLLRLRYEGRRIASCRPARVTTRQHTNISSPGYAPRRPGQDQPGRQRVRGRRRPGERPAAGQQPRGQPAPSGPSSLPARDHQRGLQFNVGVGCIGTTTPHRERHGCRHHKELVCKHGRRNGARTEHFTHGSRSPQAESSLTTPLGPAAGRATSPPAPSSPNPTTRRPARHHSAEDSHADRNSINPWQSWSRASLGGNCRGGPGSARRPVAWTHPQHPDRRE